jgi:hypothetical protein
VFFTAIIPATRAIPSTSPFSTVPAAAALRDSADMQIFPPALAKRAVSGFLLTSAMIALPCSSKCVNCETIVPPKIKASKKDAKQTPQASGFITFRNGRRARFYGHPVPEGMAKAVARRNRNKIFYVVS